MMYSKFLQIAFVLTKS